jgi:hypothetical protein
MEIISNAGGIIIAILVFAVVMMGMVFLISLMGRASNTTFITRGGNVIYDTDKKILGINSLNIILSEIAKLDLQDLKRK